MPRSWRDAALGLSLTLSLASGTAGQDPDSIQIDSIRVDSIQMDSLQALDSLQLFDSLQAFTAAPDTVQLGSRFQIVPTLQIPEAVLTYLGQLTHAYFDTPAGMGLIPTGMAEAAIAAEHVRVAGADSLDLANMTGNMLHVLHAIDPTEVGNGLGLGYGFKRAAEAVRVNAELALAEDSVPEMVSFHLPYISGAATGAIGLADEAIAVARSVQRAETPEDALGLLDDLAELVREMAYGADRDRDGRIGSTDSESGLAKATYHLQLIYRLAGIPMPEPVAADSIGR